MNYAIDFLQARLTQWKTQKENLLAKGWSAIPKTPDAINIDVIDEQLALSIYLLKEIRNIQTPDKTILDFYYYQYIPPIESWMNQVEGQLDFIHNIYNNLNYFLPHLYTQYIVNSKASKFSVLRNIKQVALLNDNVNTLNDKIDKTYDNVDSFLSKIENSDALLENLSKNSGEATQLIESIRSIHSETQNLSGAIGEINKTANDLIASTNKLSSESETIQHETNTQLSNVNNLHVEIAEIQGRIEAYLAGATTIGLAKSFTEAKMEASKSRKEWGQLFFYSILALVLISMSDLIPFVKENTESVINIGGYIVIKTYKLFLAAPIIWVGWICAKQLSISARLQRLYEHKATISMAFQGYKEEMKELGPEASAHFSKEAVDAISYNPERIYTKKGGEDGHPSESMFKNLTEKLTELVKRLPPKSPLE